MAGAASELAVDISCLRPAAVMVLHTLFCAVYLGYCRFVVIASKKIPGKYWRTYDSSVARPPEFAEQASNHFKNLFEVPMLFYAACFTAALLNVGKHSLIHVALWVFYLLRLVHSYIHLTYNNPRHRLASFALSLTILGFIWVQLTLMLF